MKKVYFIILILLVAFCFTTPVFAKNISSCDAALSSDVIIDEKIPNIISTVVTVIKVIVPVLLVVFGMIDLAKGVIAQKDEEIKNGQKIFIKRLISGVIVFFVFSLVQFLISLVAGSQDSKNIFDCANCFINNECTYRKDVADKCPEGTTLIEDECVPAD